VGTTRRSFTKRELFAVLEYEPNHQVVWDYHDSDARLRIVSAPARTSKSYSAAHDLLVEGLPELERLPNGLWVPGETQLNWVVGIDYATTKEFDYLWLHLVDGRLSELFNVESARKNPDQGNMRIVLNLGKTKKGQASRVIYEVKSANHERSLQGEEVHRCILSEAAEHPPKVWDQYLSTRVGRATWPTTPKQAARWIYDQILSGEQDPELSIDSFTFPPEANPTYNWDRYHIEERKAQQRARRERGPRAEAKDDPWFAEQFLGQWVFYEGSVLPFHEEQSFTGWSHLVDDVPAWAPAGYWAWSFDAGYNDPYAGLLWVIGLDGTMVVVDEFYERKLGDHEVVDRVREIEQRHRVEPQCYVGDPKKPQLTKILHQHGLPVFNTNPNKTAKRAPGFRLLINLMSEDPKTGRPKLFVHKRCGQLIREMQNIRHKPDVRDEYGEGSMVGDDHALDALRYGAMVLHMRRPRVQDQKLWWRDYGHRQRTRDVMRRNEIHAGGGSCLG
jgi:hypothetical protein